MFRKIVIAKVLFVLVVLGFYSCSRVNLDSKDYYQHTRKIRHGIVPIESGLDSSGDRSAVRTLNSESVARGRVLYQNHCMDCHGPQGLGGFKSEDSGVTPPNLQESIRDIPDFNFYLSLSQWKGEMPGWEHPFDESEREDIAQYLMSLVR